MVSDVPGQFPSSLLNSRKSVLVLAAESHHASVDSTRTLRATWRGDVPPILTPFVFCSPGEQH